MLKKELRRLFFSNSLLFTYLLGIILLCIGSWDILMDMISGYSFGTYLEKFLISFGYGMTSLMAILFPILSMIPYTLSYKKERDSGFIHLLTLKCTRKEYRSAKIITTFCSGFLALFVPCLIWYLINFLIIGTGDTKHPIIYGLMFAENLYSSYPFLYGLLYVCNAGLQGGVFSLVGLGISSIVKSKFLALLLPFAYCIFSAAILEVYSQALNALTLIVIGQYYNTIFGHWGILLYDIILTGIGVGVFILGDIYACKN